MRISLVCKKCGRPLGHTTPRHYVSSDIYECPNCGTKFAIIYHEDGRVTRED